MVGDSSNKVERHVISHYPIVVTEEVDTIHELHSAIKTLKGKCSWLVGKKKNGKYMLYRSITPEDRKNAKFITIIKKRIAVARAESDNSYLYPSMIVKIGE